MITNDSLEFDEGSHTYTLNGVELTSVTEFIDEFFPGFDAPAVAEEKAYSYGKYADKSKGEILQMWSQSGQDGTRIHKHLEDWLNGKEVEFEEKSEQGARWWKEYTTRRYILEVAPELKVYSEELGLAGTIDVAVKHVNEHGGMRDQISLVDWKTNNGIYKTPYEDGETGTHSLTERIPDANWHHYSLQLSLYAHILEEAYDQSIYKLHLVHLKQDDVEEHIIPYRKEKVSQLCQEKTRQKQNS